MAALEVHRFFGDVRSAYAQVARPLFRFLGQALELLDDRGAIGKPEWQPGSDFFIEEEQLQLASDPAVVALFGLFELPEVLVQVLLAGPGGSVDALQLLASLIPAPVGPGDVEQLEHADIAAVGYVGAAAQIDELARVIEAGRRDVSGIDVRIFVAPHPRGAALLQIGQQFDLVVLAEGSEPLNGRLDGHFLALERMALRRDLPHLFLDARQIIRGDAARHVDVVIKTIFDGGPDAEFDAREKPLDRGRHHMRGAVSHGIEIRVLFHHASPLAGHKKAPRLGTRGIVLAVPPELSAVGEPLKAAVTVGGGRSLMGSYAVRQRGSEVVLIGPAGGALSRGPASLCAG